MSTQVQTGRKTIVVCDTQPITIEGVRVLLAPCPDLKFAGGVCGLLATMDLVNCIKPALVLVDKAMGLQTILDWMHKLAHSPVGVVVWGTGIGNAEAMRIVQAGARGVVQKTADPEQLLSCLRTAAAGATWISDTIFQQSEREPQQRSTLTAREQQVVHLVERGLKNKDIAHDLGIQTGTVKIHLKHIFEKTGCRGRYGLALTGLRDKGQLNLAIM